MQNKHQLKKDIVSAILRGEEFHAITFDEVTKHIMLPTAQKAGTSTQCRTYAEVKAQEIIESL